MAVELTEEIRRAVMLEMCANEGHVLDVSKALGATDNQFTAEVRGDGSHLPHLRCSRCGRVWLVVETGAESYEQAEEGAFAQLNTETPFKKRINELREKRRNGT